MIKSKDEVIDKIHLDKADVDEIDITTKTDISMLLKKNEPVKEYETEIKLKENLKLPIKKGTVVGKLTVKDNGANMATVDVIVTFLNYTLMY